MKRNEKNFTFIKKAFNFSGNLLQRAVFQLHNSLCEFKCDIYPATAK